MDNIVEAIEVTVERMIEDRVDYGFYICINGEGIGDDGNDDFVVADDMNDFFAQHGVNFDHKKLVVAFGAYDDNGEFFFHEKEKAENYRVYVEKLIYFINSDEWSVVNGSFKRNV